jgi:lysophospholipase L1-like esterase
MVLIRSWLAVLLLGGSVFAQQSALMSRDELLRAGNRAIELMDAAGIALPDLARAGLPCEESAKTALSNIGLRSDYSPHHLDFLTALRTYILVSDSVPKPFPFPEEARRQLAELRDLQQRWEAHFRELMLTRERQVRSADPSNLDRYAEANALVAPPDPMKRRVVFLGDSITAGWRLNEYFPDRDFLNRGISGQVTTQMLGRMKADVIALKPAAVLILAGTNDLARGTAINRIVDNYAMMTDLAGQYNIKVIFASVLPVSDHHKQIDPRFERTPERPLVSIRALNDWLQRYCNGRNCVYLDYWSKMVDESGQLKAEYADDGLHPNAAGYRVMAPLALEVIDRVVPPAAQPKPRRKRPSDNPAESGEKGAPAAKPGAEPAKKASTEPVKGT